MADDTTPGAKSAALQETTEATVKGSYTSEMRVSLVLYGGSSLVVYMNGVAQELLRMVQATTGLVIEADAAQADPRYGGYELAARISQHDIDTGYADLLYNDPENRHDRRSADEVLASLEDRKSRRRLTIDVLSGASAGGLNAVFLARALLMNGDVSEAERLLVEHGDVLTILNNPDPGVAGRWPKSLLDGDRLYSLMLEGLYQQGDAAQGGALVDALDCYLALTDLRGVSREAATEVYDVDLDHRASAHLRYGTAKSFGAERNDFVGCVEGDSDAPPLEPFLAFVGRATSAHPAAFHPVQLRRIGEIVADLEASGRVMARAGTDGKVPSFDVEHELWSKLIGPGHPDAPLTERWFSDGGDLDNKPFTHSIDPVESRRASIPVDRKVVWVEPKPGEKTEAWNTDVAPGLGTVTFGAYGLPRKEGTFEDLRKIQERNRVARLLRQSVDEAIPPSTWVEPERVPDWVNQQPASPERRLYEVERARYVVNHLLDWAERTFREAGGEDRLVDELRAAVLAKVGPPHSSDSDAPMWNHRRLLVAHDLSYRIRRLNHADQRLARRQRLFLEPSQRGAEWSKLVGWREEFTAIYVELLAVDRQLKGEDVNETDSMAGNFELPDGSGLDITQPEDFAGRLLEQRDEALETVMSDTSGAAKAILARIRDAVSEPPEPAAGTPDDPLRSLGSELTKAWVDFDIIDMHLLPRYRDLRGELDAIEAVRFSPNDTTLMGNSPERRLGGVGVHNFGGFFDKRWRRNDILWGRLDTAELVVKMLIPTEGLSDGDRGVLEEVQGRLILRLQHQIIEESSAAIRDIAELAPDSGIAVSDDPPALREALKGLELNLALAGDDHRRDRWGEILGSIPTVLGGIVALAGFDPWKGQKITGDEPDDEEAKDQLRNDMRIRTERVGTTFDGAMQLISPQNWTPWIVRFVMLPLLAAGSLIGMWSAYGDDHNDLWWIGGGIVVGAACFWLRRRRIHSSGPSATTKLLAALAVLVPLAGVLMPLVGDSLGVIDDAPDDREKAFVFTLLFVAAAVGLLSIWLWRSLGRGPKRNVAFAVFVVGGIVALIAAALFDLATATQLLGSLMVFGVSAGLFLVLRSLQAKVDAFAMSSPHDDAS